MSDRNSVAREWVKRCLNAWRKFASKTTTQDFNGGFWIGMNPQSRFTVPWEPKLWTNGPFIESPAKNLRNWQANSATWFDSDPAMH